jgi:hypothetical protein
MFLACKKKQDIAANTAQTTTSTDTTIKPADTTVRHPITVNTAVGTGASATDSFITYLIKKGNNYCENNAYNITNYIYLHFRASFDSSGIYSTDTTANQQDINKLYGFADCSSHHQTNSARFGWNWYNGAMHIHAYCYSGGVRSYKELGIVNLKETFDCQLTVLPGKYLFTLNGKTDTMSRGCTDNSAFGYKLLPYFGGNEAAKQDVRIRIREL